MRQFLYGCGVALMMGLLVVAGTNLATAEDAPTSDSPAKAPAEFLFTKVGDAGQVKFKHEGHGKAACSDCHEGAAPLFPQVRAKEPYKMADIYAGKYCGACHDGKKAFAAKGDCTKCHASEE
ncbi:MAG: cytochrome c family protein [Candidatus Ozemobacter sibiricus]|jgi:c(7)-type cytochrome triheme protein|uniref:Cytochrome c family protein n=1 Tax=Candidatus Ozemobacter sibiricus TaxID=2268124 RepID=A0A367ZRT2_9BACT|nr:MAG: cytochrome c family protein [Candidatus Ozemobacter sibiricus]